MSKLLKRHAKNANIAKVLKDPEKLKQVLYLVQETVDDYMNEVRTKLNDPRKSVQEKAQAALDIAQSIIEAEKQIRELELYNSVGMKNRGMNVITDV